MSFLTSEKNLSYTINIEKKKIKDIDMYHGLSVGEVARVEEGSVASTSLRDND